MEGNMCSNMHVTEMKRKGLKKAILSLLVEWKEFEDHFGSSPSPGLNQLQYHAQESRKERSQEGLERNQVGSSQNPMHEKLKEIDVSNGSCDDRVEVLENEVEKLKERWERLVWKEREVGRVEGLCEEKLKEIDGKLKELEFSRNFVEERAKELELKQKELDDGFRDLESRKLKVTQNPKKIDGFLCSSADGVPNGCLELDPASLPDSLTVLCYPGKVNTEIGSRDTIKRSGRGQVNLTTESPILKTATKVGDNILQKSRRTGLVNQV